MNKEELQKEQKMTNLRWIESEIDRLIFSIERSKILNKNGDVAIQEKRLTHLNQIKIKLEAWEAIKSELVIEKHVDNLYEDEYRTITFKSGCIDDIEILENKSKINAISKALEVKDE